MNAYFEQVGTQRAKVREASEAWEKMAVRMEQIHTRIGGLLDERALAEQKIESLLTDRRRARFLVGEELKRRRGARSKIRPTRSKAASPST
jgi:hypothetical protein